MNEWGKVCPLCNNEQIYGQGGYSDPMPCWFCGPVTSVVDEYGYRGVRPQTQLHSDRVTYWDGWEAGLKEGGLQKPWRLH